MYANILFMSNKGHSLWMVAEPFIGNQPYEGWTNTKAYFNQPDHKISGLKMVGIEKIIHIVLGNMQETFWIKYMKTLAPEGLNQSMGLWEIG